MPHISRLKLLMHICIYSCTWSNSCTIGSPEAANVTDAFSVFGTISSGSMNIGHREHSTLVWYYDMCYQDTVTFMILSLHAVPGMMC